jgi:hypothetical protein
VIAVVCLTNVLSERTPERASLGCVFVVSVEKDPMNMLRRYVSECVNVPVQFTPEFRKSNSALFFTGRRHNSGAQLLEAIIVLKCHSLIVYDTEHRVDTVNAVDYVFPVTRTCHQT